jgi:peptidoglycan/LPS O-acetylase OafA/YrhL
LLQERGTSTTKPARTASVPSDVLLRLLAISTIFLGHGAPAHTLWLRGGSAILFCLAGYSLCRFQRDQLLAGRVLPAISGTLQRIILPYLLLTTVLLFATGKSPHPSWWTLSSVFFVDTWDRGILFSYWFIESLFHCMLIVSLPFLIPGYRRWAQARPFEQGAVAVGFGIAALFAGRYLFDSAPFSHKFDGWLYIYLIGWTLALAQSAWQKTMLIVAGSIVATIQFGPDTSRPYWFIGALVVLATVRAIRLPTVLAVAVSEVAAISYMAYLVHPLVLHVTKFVLPTRDDAALTIFLSYTGTIAAGFIATIVWNQVYKRVVRLFSRTGRAPEGVISDRTAA